MKLTKKNGRTDTHKKCRLKLNSLINSYNLTDVWRSLHQDKKQYTWHSNSKPPIFCRLDFFLISSHLINCTTKCNINTGYKSDHSIVILSINFNKINRGPGYFKLNNSLILLEDYQTKIRNSIRETAEINLNSNPNTLWEIIKGNIRNETIKYSSYKKKIDTKIEHALENDIKKIESQLISTNNTTSENFCNLKKEIETKKQQLNDIIDTKINGLIIRSKALNVDLMKKTVNTLQV